MFGPVEAGVINTVGQVVSVGLEHYFGDWGGLRRGKTVWGLVGCDSDHGCESMGVGGTFEEVSLVGLLCF